MIEARKMSAVWSFSLGHFEQLRLTVLRNCIKKNRTTYRTTPYFYYMYSKMLYYLGILLPKGLEKKQNGLALR